MSDEYASKTFEVEVLVDPRTGRIVGERWHDQFGGFDRPGDLPAYVDYCPDTGIATYARWHKEGDLHRDGDKPATVVTRPHTGIVVAEQYAILGHPHREGDKPATIYRDDRGRVQEHGFYRHGELHREGLPAVERFWASGKLKSSEHWLHGRRQEEPPQPVPPLLE